MEEERTKLYADFVARFANDTWDGRAQPCSSLELDRIEADIETYLPQSYRQFVSSHGAVWVSGLWDALVERESASLHPLYCFLRSGEVINDTRLYWSGGMPTDFVGVAGDYMGNLFGFHRASRSGYRPDDLPVSLFDHDFVRIVPVADSFDDWLRWFLEKVSAGSI